MNIRWILWNNAPIDSMVLLILWKEKTGQSKNWEFMAWIQKHVRVYETQNKTKVGYNQDAFTSYLQSL